MEKFWDRQDRHLIQKKRRNPKTILVSPGLQCWGTPKLNSHPVLFLFDGEDLLVFLLVEVCKGTKGLCHFSLP